MPKRSRKGASASKKDNTERTRRSTRRRGHQKSESEAEDSGSDRSTDEPKDDGKKDEATGNNDSGKGDESGSSDGAWQVRSENGNKGGIPKLKLCLQRPPEISSPTPEPLASPRTRRSRKGASPTTKAEESNADEPALPGRSNVEVEVTSTGRKRPAEEQEEESSKVPAHSKLELSMTTGEELENQIVNPSESVKPEKIENEEETGHLVIEAHDVNAKVEEVKEDLNIEVEEERGIKNLEEREETGRRKSREEQEAIEQVQGEDEEVMTQEQETQETGGPQAVEEEDERRRRSPSRDSSEERAKEAALKSRRNKKKEGSEDGEVVESPERDLPFPNRTGVRIKTTAISQQGIEYKQSQETAVPVVRKRRWGSSASRTGKKSTLSISTDVLKEIIPEAKPVALSEVHLSPNGDITMEEGEVESIERRDSRSEERPRVAPERKREAPSDESEKDYEEEGVESGGEDMVKKRTTETLRRVRETEPTKMEAPIRRVASFPTDPIFARERQKSLSPARNSPTCILHITNLVRPFTLSQLRDLLARTGSIVAENGFWIDKVKSHCFVKYCSEEEAKNTRDALHGVTWPASNPKQLFVDYGTEADLKAAVDGKPPPLIPLREARLPNKIIEERREREVERKREAEKESIIDRDRREKERGRERDKERIVSRKDDKEKDRKVEADREPLKRTVRKVTIPVREWDLGKTERGFSPPPLPVSGRRYGDNERDFEDGRRNRDKDRARRSSSEEPVRKIKRKSEDAPTKLLLDDLFRKTKTTPSIYWLPLTSEQIAVREEMRRKHMAEHEKRIAEMRRKRDGKRRRRSGTRSRSRSPKK